MRAGSAVIDAFDRTSMEALFAVALLNLACSESRLGFDLNDGNHVAPSGCEDEYL